MCMRKTHLLICISIVVCTLFSCIPYMDSFWAPVFKNCTNDTIYIGASHYANIDSVDVQVFSVHNIVDDGGLDTSGIILWKGENWAGTNSYRNDYVYPDSLCTIDGDYLFGETDTCYFFIIKWSDAKKYSWDEIRYRKLYKTWIVARNENAEFPKDIKYIE